MPEPLIFELGAPDRRGYSLPDMDIEDKDSADLIPSRFLREEKPALPEVSEVETVRHYTRLSKLNYGVDSGIYPLGTCTMKYNPKVHEDISRFSGWLQTHPYLPEELIQGALQLLYELGNYLAEITGMDRFTFQPAAGAHGELTGLLMVQAYHLNNGEKNRSKVIVPDSAHGTNPASASVCGYDVIEVESNERGLVDIKKLKKIVDQDLAAFMVTNPNTLGLFEEDIMEIADIVHQAGGLLYYDGANTNALMGLARPGDMNFDIIHLNIHKTFSTPHGGGGPGSGPVGVNKKLIPFLPTPLISQKDDGSYYLDYNLDKSIGRVRTFHGNFNVLVKAYAYIRTLGPDGIKKVSKNALLNANYMMKQLKDYYELPYDRFCMHEFVLSGSRQKKEQGVTTMEIAKRLLDYGHYAPTIYFPLIVKEALMVEPTETESKQSLDEFISSMKKIAREIEKEPKKVKNAPHKTEVRRLDELQAAREPDLRWNPEEKNDQGE